jgi:hypothetical protein
MTSFGEDVVYPSVRLKNLRRGIQDAGYVSLARSRAETRTEADAVVARLVPAALRDVKEGAKTPWPEDARPWLDARRELFTLVMRAPKDAVPDSVRTSPAPSPKPPAESRVPLWALVTVLTLGVGLAGERVPRGRRSDGPR